MIFIRVYKCEPVEINSEQKLNWSDLGNFADITKKGAEAPFGIYKPEA